MWVFTEDGFYSAVQHRDEPDLLVIRTRVKADVDFLHEVLRDLGAPSEVSVSEYSDYPWRTITTKGGWAEYLRLTAVEIDYPNYKARVAESQGDARARAYGKVWEALLPLEYADPEQYHPRVQALADAEWPFT